MPSDACQADLATLVAVIGRSQIVVSAPALRPGLPAGFDAIDVAILAWIAAESRRLRRRCLAM